MIKWENNLTRILKIRYPIVQSPMLSVTTPEMVAAVSNNGGLGALPVGGLSPARVRELIQNTKKLTNKPFAVNLLANEPEQASSEQVELMQKFLEEMCFRHQLPYHKEQVEKFEQFSYKDQVEVLLAENIPVVSFTFGILDDESVKAFKSQEAILIGTATCTKEAKLLDQKGVDIVVAQGIEAGGHRGTFVDGPLPQVGLLTLVTQMVSCVDRPVIAAGGINDGRTIKAVLTLGAAGVQIGSAFIASDESAAMPSYKTVLRRTTETDAVLTRSFSGRWARGIRNEFISEVENSGLNIPGYPVQLSLVAPVRMLATQQDNANFAPLWAGQGACKAEAKPVSTIFLQLVKEAEALE